MHLTPYRLLIVAALHLLMHPLVPVICVAAHIAAAAHSRTQQPLPSFAEHHPPALMPSGTGGGEFSQIKHQRAWQHDYMSFSSGQIKENTTPKFGH
jgi:hypothetical protein